MNVTIKQIRAFVAIATSQSFAEACQRLYLSQPALSIAIKNLEQSVGGKLLARTTRTLALTPEGQEFLPIAQSLLADWDSSLSDLNNVFALRRGNLIMAAMPSYAATALPGFMLTFKQKYPAINIKIHDVIFEDAVAMVRAGRAELALTFEPPACDDLHFEPLFTDTFVAALPPKHPLLAQQSCTWQQLAQHPFIALQRPSKVRQLIEESLAKDDISLNTEFEMNQIITIGQMVAKNLGVSAVPALCVEQFSTIGVECRPLTSPAISRQVGIVTRRRYVLSSAGQALIELIRAKHDGTAGAH